MTIAAVMTLSGETPAGSGLDGDVALAAGGDQSAFERLYRTHVARIHSLTRRMLSTQEADEVTQDIFVRTWQKLGQFRGDSAFSTWLHRLAVNVVIERRRSFAIQRERMSDDPTALDLLTVAPARADLTVDFEQAIDQLPPGAREIFVLHDVEGYKHREIAAMLDIATGTSKRQLHQGAHVDAETSFRGMIVHEEWTDQLSDYLDGELPAEERERRRRAPAGLRVVHGGAQRSEARRRARRVGNAHALRRPTCGPASRRALRHRGVRARQRGAVLAAARRGVSPSRCRSSRPPPRC